MRHWLKEKGVDALVKVPLSYELYSKQQIDELVQSVDLRNNVLKDKKRQSGNLHFVILFCSFLF